MLSWLHQVEDECVSKGKQRKDQIYLIPEDLFSHTPNHVFRKFMKTEPWRNSGKDKEQLMIDKECPSIKD